MTQTQEIITLRVSKFMNGYKLCRVRWVIQGEVGHVGVRWGEMGYPGVGVNHVSVGWVIKGLSGSYRSGSCRGGWGLMRIYFQFIFNLLQTHRVSTIHEWIRGNVYEWGKFLKP